MWIVLNMLYSPMSRCINYSHSMYTVFAVSDLMLSKKTENKKNWNTFKRFNIRHWKWRRIWWTVIAAFLAIINSCQCVNFIGTKMQCKTPIYNLYRSTKYHNLFTTTSCSAGCLMMAMMIINSLSIVCLNAEVTQNNKINPNSIGTVSLSRTLLLIYLDPELYVNKSAFSYLHKMTTWHCPHSPTTRHCCSNWSISPACCRFAAVGPCWDRQTNR